MIPNKLKQKWKRDEATINGWAGIGNAFTAEIIAAQGYDSVTIDIQHGFLGFSEARTMLQAVRASGVVPLVRVPWREPGIIMKSLDAGAYGIICPMINNAEEAAEFAAAMRYPPLGSRSFGPTRVNFSAGENYAAEANDQVLALAMIETADGVKNAEAICNTDGIDGVYIGPADLTLGVAQGRLPPGFDREEDDMIAAIKKILEAAKKAGIVAALHCGAPEYAKKVIDWGFDMVTLSTDARLFAEAVGRPVRELRQLLGEKGNNADEDKKSTGY